MRILQENPDLTQRDLGDKPSMCFGGLNFRINALFDMGLVKMQNLHNSNNKFKYVYLLKPMGVVEKLAMICRFLGRNMEEYEALKLEIEELKAETQRENSIFKSLAAK